MMIIEPLEAADLSGLGPFQPEGWSDIIELFRYNIQKPFCSPLKMTEGGKLVAVGNAIFYGDTVWLSQIIVHPEFRNRGHGRSITLALLKAVDRSRYETIVLDATRLGYPVYEAIGFTTVSNYIHLVSPEDPVFMNSVKTLRRAEEKDWSALCELDYLATGERRDSKLEEGKDNVMIYAPEKKLLGFYMPQLGKGLVIAANAEAGKILLGERLKLATGAMLPEENKEGIDFLVSQGWQITRSSRRMILGKPLIWNPDQIYNVISGGFG